MKSQCWDLPAENISSFQFAKDARRLDDDKVKEVENLIEKYQSKMDIEISKDVRAEIEVEIEKIESNIQEWLKRESVFFKKGEKLDLNSREGSETLQKDLENYMASVKMGEIEKRTAETFVLNPYSGEWIKGMEIVLAEMGFVSYKRKIPRTKDIFEGLGTKEKRRKYLIYRLAFVRAYFHLLGIDEVILYRGMSSEREWTTVDGTLLSCTFSLEVAQSFSDLKKDSKYKNSYIVKRTYLVSILFMTYLETKAMNMQYTEAEALVFFNAEESIL